jgi:predicted RNA-binding Zn-ribbon protein involved in translation (DUF1610 family)
VKIDVRCPECGEERGVEVGEGPGPGYAARDLDGVHVRRCGPCSWRAKRRFSVVRCPRCGTERHPARRVGGWEYPRAPGEDHVHLRLCESCGQGTPVRLRDAEWLARAYVEFERSATEIAEELGCGHGTVTKWLRRHGIPVRSRSEATRLKYALRSRRDEFGRNRQMVTGGVARSDVVHLPAGDRSGVGR